MAHKRVKLQTRDGLPHPAYSRNKKRSIVIDGRRTSVSLEDEFWRRLRAISYMTRLDLSAVVSTVNAYRGSIGLSSALRQFVLSQHSHLPLSRLAGSEPQEG